MSPRSRSTATPVDQKDYFISRLSQWDLKLKEALKKAGVSHDIVSKMVVVPVGYQDDLHLPDCDDWLSTFWLACLKRINKRATLALFKISADRLPQEGDTSTQKESAESDQLSVAPEEIEKALLTMTSGFVVGAAAGSILPGAGTAVGGAIGMMVGAFPFVIHSIRQELQMKKKAL